MPIIDGDAARTERDDQKQAADHGERLEEVVLEKIVFVAVRWSRPKSVHGEIDQQQPADEHQSAELGFEADRDEEHQHSSDDELQYIEHADLESQ